MIVWKLSKQPQKNFTGKLTNIGDVVKKKIHAVREKNSGYINFKTINKNMIVTIDRYPSNNLELLPSNIAHFKYTTITPVDVERSLAVLKIFCDHQILLKHITFNRLKEILIIQ